ncbi:MAG: hypothetical protein FWH20_00400 [Oscillospiraceae bacterium]|nr:hypothetical protein [Oscillospiraceae bacterium]
MKAILELKLPRNCRECILKENGVCKPISHSKEERAEFCPLKIKGEIKNEY